MLHTHRIAPGAAVTLAFRLSLADGTVVDAADREAPLRFSLGDGTLVPGLEAPLEGLGAGASATVYLGPGEAFPEPDPANVHAMPRADFPDGMAVEPGAVVAFALPSGEEVAGTVLEMGEAAVTVDFNHPLAGKALVLEFEVLAVEPPARGQA